MRLAIPAVLILATAFSASAADPTTGVIRITATYPGADAKTIDETILARLFQQINGVEGATRIESEARNDGTGTVTVYFEPKTDLNLAQVMVQSRANLALPVLPAPCQQLGMPVRKLSAGPPAYWLALTSADNTHDAAFLGAYATIHLKDELARIPGVADVRVVGVGEFGVRVLLKPDRLAAYKVTAGDVVNSLRRQNAQVAAGAVGGEVLQQTVTASGRLTRSDQFANVILKASPNGEVLRLKDVARVESGVEMGGFVRVDGKPAALIAVTAWPGRVTADKFYKIEAIGDLPPGMRFDVVADRAADRLLEVEVRLPPSASLERTEKVVERATELIRGRPGKPGTVAFTESREPNSATIFVKVAAKGGPTAADVEGALAVIPDAVIRVDSVQPGGEAFPIRLALTDSGEQGEERLAELADRVVTRLAKDAGVTEVAAFPGPAAPHFTVKLDRDKCATLGVELDDIFTTLQTTLSGVHATEFSKFGRTCRVTVQAEPRPARRIEDLTQLKVRSGAGDMVSLDKMLTIRKNLASPAVVRVNGFRAVIFTATPEGGKTAEEVAARCVKLAQEGLPKGYRIKDLTSSSR